jgi:hypothetical protein
MAAWWCGKSLRSSSRHLSLYYGDSVCSCCGNAVWLWGPHQPLLLKKKWFFFLKKTPFFDWRNWYQIDFKIFISNWLHNFHIKLISNFRIKIRRNIKKKKNCLEFDMSEKKFDRGIWRFLIGVWPIYRSKCIPNTYQIFISNTYQTPISLSRQVTLKCPG